MQLSGVQSLLSTLRLRRGSVVALIGSGGKTSTMLALAREIGDAGWSCIITTTTKIWPPNGIPFVPIDGRRETANDELTGRHAVAIGRSIGPEGKVMGIDPETPCRLAADRIADVVLVEADGAAGRPLKGHRDGEPVVPACSSAVLIVAGLGAVGRPAGPETVLRLEEFERATGLAPGQLVSAAAVARSLLAQLTFVPPRAAPCIVLNQADGERELDLAHDVVRELRGLRCTAPVVATSRGEIRRRWDTAC